jgi:hypothetical protein
MTPFALWTHVLLKGGEAMLDSMQAVVKRTRPGVAVIPTADAPPRDARAQDAPIAPRKAPAEAKPKRKAKTKAKAKPASKSKARTRSAKASARRR